MMYQLLGYILCRNYPYVGDTEEIDSAHINIWWYLCYNEEWKYFENEHDIIDDIQSNGIIKIFHSLDDVDKWYERIHIGRSLYNTWNPKYESTPLKILCDCVILYSDGNEIRYDIRPMNDHNLSACQQYEQRSTIENNYQTFLYTNIAGLKYIEDEFIKQKIKDIFEIECPYILFEREPQNQYDNNAVAIKISPYNEKIGYIPKKYSNMIAQKIDSGADIIGEVVYSNGNHYKMPTQITIKLKEKITNDENN